MSDFDVLLQFNNNNRRLSFSVTINDDEILESIEDFDLELRFDPFVTPPSGVILSPNVSTVYIEDNDGNYIFDCSYSFTMAEKDTAMLPGGYLPAKYFTWHTHLSSAAKATL